MKPLLRLAFIMAMTALFITCEKDEPGDNDQAIKNTEMTGLMEAFASPNGIQPIDSVTPAENDTVSIAALIQVTFKTPPDSTVRFTYDNKVYQYRIGPDFLRLSVNGNKPVDGEVIRVNDTTLTFKMDNTLPAGATARLEAQVSLRVFFDDEWQNTEQVYNRETNFHTENHDGGLALSNIEYSYSIDKQVNLYADEYGTGYIKLYARQDEVFDVPAGWQQNYFTGFTLLNIYYAAKLFNRVDPRTKKYPRKNQSRNKS